MKLFKTTQLAPAKQELTLLMMQKYAIITFPQSLAQCRAPRTSSRVTVNWSRSHKVLITTPLPSVSLENNKL